MVFQDRRRDMLKIKKFKYKKEGTITERELLVVKEANIKGGAYYEGFCLSSLADKRLAEQLRGAAEHMTISQADNKIVIDVSKGFDPDIKAAMKCWRRFDKDRIVG
jgi:hypothetical protein